MSNKTLKIVYQIILYAIILAVLLKPFHIVIPVYIYILTIIFMVLSAVYVIKRVYSQDELFKKVMPRFLYLGLFGLVGYLLATNNCFRDIKGCFTCNSSIVDTLADDIGEE